MTTQAHTLRRRLSRSVDRLEKAGWLSKSARLRGRYGSAFLVYELLHAWGPVAESFRARVITPLRQQRKAPCREAHGDETGQQRTEGESARAAAPARGAATMCRARRGG
jgi:hypothetical protein